MMAVWRAGVGHGVEAGTRRPTAEGPLRTGDRWESRNTESLSRFPLFPTSCSIFSPSFCLFTSFPPFSLRQFLFFFYFFFNFSIL